MALMKPVDGVATRTHRFEDRSAMLLVAREERRLDFGLGHRHVHPLAMVLDRDDIRMLLGEERQQLDQLAGTVREPGADDQIAARGREAVAHDLNQERRVDVAAGEERDDWAVSSDT